MFLPGLNKKRTHSEDAHEDGRQFNNKRLAMTGQFEDAAGDLQFGGEDSIGPTWDDLWIALGSVAETDIMGLRRIQPRKRLDLGKVYIFILFFLLRVIPLEKYFMCVVYFLSRILTSFRVFEKRKFAKLISAKE